jgi:hypothetical protein
MIADVTSLESREVLSVRFLEESEVHQEGLKAG